MKRAKRIYGFTLLEMLTAMAIIAVMIGLLIPAIGKIQTMAQTVKQKAQFNAIGVALEAFPSESRTGDYPPSYYTGAGNTGYCGAQKLAEAIVGMDGFGFHPLSQWRSDGLQDTNGDGIGDVPLYYGATGFDSLAQAQKDENLKSRKGPYLELEKANAVKASSIYIANTNINLNTYVLADMFPKKMATGKKTGMPLLYFRADTSKSGLYSGLGTLTPSNSIYNLEHNFIGFVFPRAPWNTSLSHPMWDAMLFYQRIRNPNFPGTAANNFTDARPYRNDSFILLSAGPDGLYGTPDDVYNFDENEK